MRISLVIVAAILAGPGCGKKQDSAPTAGSDTKPVEPAPPATCPPGSVVKAGVCTAVITAEKVEVVATQRTRLDDLGKLLDQADVVGAPIELLDGFRQTDAWKQLSAGSSKLAVVDQVVATLNDAVKQLRTLRGSLGEASTRLGDLHGELDKLLKEPGVARTIEDVQAKVSSEVLGVVQPLEAEVTATIQKVLVPLTAQLTDAGDLVIGACAMAKVSGGGDKLKALCAQAKDVFGKATTYLTDLKAKPSALFADLTTQLQTALGELIDTTSRQAIADAQKLVDDAVKLPAAGGGSAAPGSGSATP